MAYMLAITLQSRPGSADTFRSVLADITPPSRAEAGNIRFEVARSVDDENTFFVLESYIDEAAYQAHLQTAAFARVEQELFPLLEDRDVRTYATLVE